MNKITMKDIETALKRLNYYLEPTGLRIEDQRQYGYNCLHLYDKKGRIIKDIATGLSKKEAYYMLIAFERILNHVQLQQKNSK